MKNEPLAGTVKAGTGSAVRRICTKVYGLDDRYLFTGHAKVTFVDPTAGNRSITGSVCLLTSTGRLLVEDDQGNVIDIALGPAVIEWTT